MTILGKVSPTTTTDTLVYTCPAATKASINISVTNRTAADTTVSIALSKSDDLGVSSVTVTAAGTGLTAIPTLSFTGGGNGSGAAATVTNLVLTSYTLATAGTGFVVGNTLTVTGGTGTAATIRVNSVDANGAITGSSVQTGGSYTAVITGTTTTLTGGNGSGATITVSTIRYGIGSITVSAAGNDYSSAPTVNVSAGSGFTLTPQMTRAAIQDTDDIEYQVVIPASGVLERTGITIGAGDAVFVQSSVANSINAFVFGVTAIA